LLTPGRIRPGGIGEHASVMAWREGEKIKENVEGCRVRQIVAAIPVQFTRGTAVVDVLRDTPARVPQSHYQSPVDPPESGKALSERRNSHVAVMRWLGSCVPVRSSIRKKGCNPPTGNP